MHGLLLYLSLIEIKNVVSMKVQTCSSEKTSQHSRGAYLVSNERLIKTDKNCFHRTKILYTVIKHNEMHGNQFDNELIGFLIGITFCHQL